MGNQMEDSLHLVDKCDLNVKEELGGDSFGLIIKKTDHCSAVI